MVLTTNSTIHPVRYPRFKHKGRLRVDQLTARCGSRGGALSHGAGRAFAYAYSAVGNRTSRIESRTGVSPVTDLYAYDATDQVTNVNYSSGSRVVGYAYDEVGNRTSVVDDSNTTSYSVNPVNQYTNITGASPLTNLTYSTDGNLTSGGGWAYTYDSQNRLVEAATADPVDGDKAMTMAYDSKNRCVNRKTYVWDSGDWSLASDLFLYYDAWNLIEERADGGTLLQAYVHGPRVDEILMKLADSAIYYHHDALGNVTSLTDTNGVLVERYVYDIYGHPTILDASSQTLSASSYTNRFLFTGREWLADVQLYDYRNRVYSALLGRFLQTDPIRFDAGDANVYRYVGNVILLETDPSGLDGAIHYFGPGDDFAQSYPRVRVPTGYLIVGAHGTYRGPEDQNGDRISIGQLAHDIRRSSGFTPSVTVIRLDSCNVGNRNGPQNSDQLVS